MSAICIHRDHPHQRLDKTHDTVDDPPPSISASQRTGTCDTGKAAIGNTSDKVGNRIKIPGVSLLTRLLASGREETGEKALQAR